MGAALFRYYETLLVSEFLGLGCATGFIQLAVQQSVSDQSKTQISSRSKLANPRDQNPFFNPVRSRRVLRSQSLSALARTLPDWRLARRTIIASFSLLFSWCGGMFVIIQPQLLRKQSGRIGRQVDSSVFEHSHLFMREWNLVKRTGRYATPLTGLL